MFNRKHFWGKGFYYLLLTCLCFGMFTKHANAAAGINQTINFQGKLVNTDGTNVTNGTYSIVFSLYTVSSGGSAAWTETDSVTTTDGVFRVPLGGGTTFSSAGIDFSSDTYYLGIKVGSDAEMTPRVQFTAVPYAFNAQKVNGLTVTNTNGTLTIPNGATISFGGSLTTSGASALTLTTSGTTNVTLPAGTITLVDSSSSQTLTNKTIGSTGLTFSGASTDMTTGTNEDLTISPNGTGKVGLFTSGTLRSTFDVHGNSGTLSIASFSGKTSFAGLIVDNNGLGDLLSASTSGLSRFTIGNTGNITDANYAGANAVLYAAPTTGLFTTATTTTVSQCLLSGSGPSGVPSWGTCPGGGTNYWQLNSGVLSPATQTNTFSIGTTGSLATMDIRNLNGTLAIASISGATSFAGLVVDNSGLGDIFSASSSGLNRFTIQQNGTIVVGNDGTPISTTIRGGTASGSNIAGANLTFDASNGTGTAGSGALIFRTAAPSSGSGTGALVQSTVASSTGGVTSQAATFGSSVTTGNLVVVVAVGFTQAISSVTDNKGNTYHLAVQQTTAGADPAIYYAYNVTGGSSFTVTANVASSHTTSLAIAEYSGATTTDPLDVTQKATGTGTAVASGNTVTTTQANEIVVGGISDDSSSNPSCTATGGFTMRQSQSNGSNQTPVFLEDQIINTTGIQNATCTLSASNTWEATVATFKIANTGNTADTLMDRLHITNSGLIGINSASPLATFAVNSILGSAPTASLSGSSTMAGLVVDNSGSGDLITASSSGLTRFQMTNNGSIIFQGDILTSIGNGGSNISSDAVTNAIGDQGSLVPNAGFESASTGIGFADGWAVAATNSAAVTRDTTAKAKGNASAKVTLNASQSTAIYSTCIPLSLANANLGSYNLNWYAIGSSAIPVVRGYIDGYTSKSNCQSNTSPTISAAQGAAITTAWAKYGSNTTGISNLGANITWGRVHIFVGCVAACTTGTTINLDGVRLIENSLGGGVDYAENYPADPHNIPHPGDVVSLSSVAGSTLVKPADVSMDSSVIGVVSTNPGQVLDDGSMPDPKVPIALAGRIPTKVSTKNGPIRIGDYLTSSDIPGVAVKAVYPGSVIGTAMEEDTDTDASQVKSVVMFVKNTYYPGYASLDATGIINGNKIQADQVEGLDVLVTQVAQLSSKVASMSANMNILGASISATQVTTTSAMPFNPDGSLDGLVVNTDATISGKLRVKGSSLFEGIVSIINTFKANDIIITGAAEFFNSVMFHNNVSFDGRPTFNADTAGFAVIKKGSDHVDVSFDTGYDAAPVVNATLTLTGLSITPPLVNGKTIEEQLFDAGYTYLITGRSQKGFTIMLNKAADQDIEFSWSALAIKNAKTFQSSGSTLLPSMTVTPIPITITP